MRVTFFDIEFANLRNHTICQIGLLSRELGNEKAEIVRKNYYVNPDDTFDENCIRVHGISAEKVVHSPSLKDVWNEIETYFVNAVVIGHNIASSGISALKNNLSRYHIELPEIYYICTYELARALIPSYSVPDYSLGSLCRLLDIPLRNRHDAFYDVCACSDLFDKLVAESQIHPDQYVRRYFPQDVDDLVSYVTNASLKKDIHELYGIVKGFALDSEISDSEKEFLTEWRKNYSCYDSHKDIADIIKTIDTVLADGNVTKQEAFLLQRTIGKYLDIISTSAVALSTQILHGLVNGMLTDDTVTEEECENLRAWLYEHNYLAGHFPFDKLFSTVEDILEDGVMTVEESLLLKSEMEKLIAPTDHLKREIAEFAGKKVYLSGNFTYGDRTAVEQYITDHHGVIDSEIDSDTDIVLLGGEDSGVSDELKAKIKQQEESGIIVTKEADFLQNTNSFDKVLYSFIDGKHLSDAEVYKKARLPRQLMSKIRCNPNYKPSKANICAFAIALELSLPEANQLLSSAGYILSGSIPFDRIIGEQISAGNYDINSINEKLYDLGLSCIGE